MAVPARVADWSISAVLRRFTMICLMEVLRE
jgi:hypothetical protein